MISKKEQNRLQKEAELHELAESIGYKVNGEYIAAIKKISITCDKGHNFEVSPQHFKRGQRCKVCSGFCPKAAEKGFLDLAESIGYKVNDEYKSAKDKVQMTCNKGHDLEVTPANFKSGSRCPVCSGRCPKAAEKKFRELAESIGYVVNGEYAKTSTKVSMTCDKGHYFEMKPASFNNGHRCPVCSGHCPKASEKSFRDLAESVNYVVKGEYKKAKDKVQMTCDKGHDFEMAPCDFKRGHRCPVCSGHCPKAAEKMLIDLAVKVGYIVNSAYKGDKSKVQMSCEKGHDFDIKPGNFKQGQRCPYCAETGFNQGKEASLYLYRWTLGDKSFIKYGITNYDDHSGRIKIQSRKTEYTPELIKEVRGSGEDVYAAERIIKEELGGKYASKEEFSDGWTETLDDNEQNISFIEDLMKEI